MPTFETNDRILNQEFEKENTQTYELFDGSSGNSMNFLDGILAVAGIGGGKDTYTSTVSGSTTVLAVALAVILGMLIYAGFGGFSVRKNSR